MLGSIWTKIIAIGAIILGILLAVLRILSGAKKAGSDEARADSADRVMTNVRESQHAKRDVDGLSGDELADRLRDPRTRK